MSPSQTRRAESTLTIRSARLADLDAMNRLAPRSKSHWGYTPQDLERWQKDLQVAPETLGRWPTFVAEMASVIVGWAQIDPRREPWALDALWVDPPHQGCGIGARLLGHVLTVSAASGQHRLSIDADPHAEGFYRKFGAQRVGTRAAPAAGHPDRARPQMEMATAPPEVGSSAREAGVSDPFKTHGSVLQGLE